MASYTMKSRRREILAMTHSGISDPLVDLHQQNACWRLSQMVFEMHKPVSLFQSVESNTSPCREAISSSKFVVFDLESVRKAGKENISFFLRKAFYIFTPQKNLTETFSLQKRESSKSSIWKAAHIESKSGYNWATIRGDAFLEWEVCVVRRFPTS